MTLVEDLRRHLRAECTQIEEILRQEHYVRRLLIAEGADLHVATVWRSMVCKESAIASIYADEILFVPRAEKDDPVRWDWLGEKLRH